MPSSAGTGNRPRSMVVGNGSHHGLRTCCGGQRLPTRSASSRSESAHCTSRGCSPDALTKPRPSGRRVSSAAAPVPIASTLSARLFTRRQIRSVQFAITASRTAPAGRWVQRIRCTPSERPRAAMSENTPCSSGKPPTTVANSSTTMTSRGNGSPSSSSSSDRTPHRASTRSRRRSSARRLSSARAAESSSRSVITPTQCGRWASGAKDDPPLKSTRRKLTASGP